MAASGDPPPLAPASPAPAPAPKRRGLKLILRSLVGLAGGLGVVALASHFSKVDGVEVWQHIKHVPLWATAFCVASSFVVLALQSLRWHRVMGPLLGLRYVDAFRAQIVGFLFNALLPARGGDLLRVQYLGKRTGKSRATILGTELVDRWLDWWGWIPTFIVLAIVSHPPSWLYKALGLFGALLFGWGTGMVLLTRSGWTPRPESRLGRIGAAIARSRMGPTLAKIFAALRVGVLSFRDRRIWVTALFIAPLPWLWESTALAIAGRAFGCDLSMVQAFSMMIAFNLATIVPSPGGVGTIESGGMLALDFFGFDHSSALAFMTVYHFSQLIPGIIGGAAVLAAEGEHLFGALAKAGESPIEGALEGDPAPAGVPAPGGVPALDAAQTTALAK